MRRSILIVLSCLGLGLIGMTCGGCDDDSNGRVAENRIETGSDFMPGGTAVVALSSDPDVLNSLIRTSATAGLILAELQDSLVEMEEDLTWSPRIAESWDVASDSLSITFHLQPWQWSDGQKLTAYDVVATFDAMMDPVVASPRRGFYQDIEKVVAVDSVTVRYELARALIDPISRVNHSILPAHRLAQLDRAQIEQWPLNMQPLSSGPFLLEKWNHNRSLVLARNQLYPGSRARLDRVVFQVIPEASARIVALEAGEIDFVPNLDPSAAKRIQASGLAKVVTVGSRQFYYMLWNFRNPVFKDAETRRALSLAIDRNLMIKSLLQGYGRPAIGPIPPALWNHSTQLSMPTFDPPLARSMLAAAGWVDEDGDGYLERDGHPLRFEILTKRGDLVRENGAIILRENFKQIGAEVDLRVLELATGLDLLRTGEFDAYFGRFVANLFGDPTGLLHSGAQDQFNFGAYANADIDALLEKAVAETDRDQALVYWNKLQETLQQDPPAAYLFYPQVLHAVGPRLQNVRPHMLSPINNLAQWWIPLEDRRYRSY